MYTERQFAALLANDIGVGFMGDEPHHPQDARQLQLRVIDREPSMLALPASHALAGTTR